MTLEIVHPLARRVGLLCRALAASTVDALEGRASLARDADQYQAAEVAALAADGFRALAELAATLLAAERARTAREVARGTSRPANEVGGTAKS